METGEVVIASVYVTDTLPLKEPSSDFLRVVSVAPLIAEAISRLDQPMGTLRELKSASIRGCITKHFT